MRTPSVEHDRLLVQGVEELLAAVDGLTGPDAETARAAVESLIDLYGTVLARIVDGAAPTVIEHGPFTADELVRHVLVAHGLLPEEPRTKPTEVVVTLGPRRATAGSRA